MATNSSLTKVLEHLIKGDEAKARDLLHQVFIEKARAIHEELMTMDEESGEFGSGDEGKDLTNQIRAMEDEVDFEQTMGEDDDSDTMDTDSDMDSMDDLEDMNVDDDGNDDDSEMPDDFGGDMNGEEGGEMSVVADKMHDLDDALAALKAEFAKMDGGEMDMGSDDEIGGDDHMEPDGDEDGEMDMHPDVSDDDEAPVDETNEWSLDEDFDDLLENLDLEVVEPNSQKVVSAGEVGSGKSGMSDGNNAKSTVPPSQTERMGAKPVVTGKGKGHTGYSLETAPSSKKLPILPKDNRRSKFEQDMNKVSKEGDGSALLNKEIPTSGKMSPLSKGEDNLKMPS